MMILRRARTVAVLALVALASILGGSTCSGGSPKVVITFPGNGIFTTASSTTVNGQLQHIPAGIIASFKVNGVSVPLVGNSFSTNVTLDTAAIFNPIVAEVTLTNGGVVRARVTVIAGDSVADGAFSEEAIALRLNDTGLDQLEPEITSLVDLDLATLLPPGTLVIDNFCYQDSIFGCLGRVDVTIDGSQPPSIGGYSIDADSQAENDVDGNVALTNLFVRAKVKAVSGIGFTCYININAATADILGNYGLQPDAGDPSSIDVFQNGSVNLVFGGFTDSTDCDGFLGFIVEALISLFIGDIQGLVEPAMEGFLNTVDGNGNTAIAGAIETALSGIEISGPIGEAIGVNLETPLFDVNEDSAGITLDNDARITASLPDPLAPNLTASLHIPEVFPSFGALSPGSLPYGLALAISTSGFNQLLKSEIESGLLRMTIPDLDFGGSLVDVAVAPTLAPIVTGNAGPGGELAELKIGGLLISLIDSATQQVIVELQADVTIGLDIGFVNGELAFTLGTLDTQNINLDILRNSFGTNETALKTLMLLALPSALPSLADSLGSFPLPDFFGLQLQEVEVTKQGEFMALYVDLVPAP